MSQEHKTSRFCILCNSESSKVIFVKSGFNLVQCPFCDLVYVSNPPSRVELEKLYSFDSGYKARLQDEQAEFKRDFSLASKHYSLIEKHKIQGRILDIGCTAGFFLKVAKESGWETYGVEISKDAAELARKRYGLEVLTGTLDEASFKPNFFDVVTIWDVIEHVENPMQTMSIINTILKDDGIVAISTPNIDGLFPRLSYKISDIINYWPHPEPPYHLFQFSKKTMYKLLEQTGFDLLAVHDERIPITYSFGSFQSLIRSPKSFLYSALFIPAALLGPMVHSGDWITVIAKKACACKTINPRRILEENISICSQ